MSTQQSALSPYLLQRYNAIYEAVAASGSDGLSASEVMLQQNLKSRKYVLSLLDQMVLAGWLRCEYIYGRYRHFRYWIVEMQ